MEKCEMAERIQEPDVILGQQAKPIEVDDTQYMPGVGILDWAEDFYVEHGGEG